MKHDSHFPVRPDLRLICLSTLILAFLLTAVSLAGLLFLGLIPIMVLQGHLGDTPDILAVAGSRLICIVPLMLFAKGITNASLP